MTRADERDGMWEGEGGRKVQIGSQNSLGLIAETFWVVEMRT
jgi:hypothetical protein